MQRSRDNLDTNKLWILLLESVNHFGTFNAFEIKIEWANHKYSTIDSKENVLSTILLAKYLYF